jgi:hypothetical protein
LRRRQFSFVVFPRGSGQIGRIRQMLNLVDRQDEAQRQLFTASDRHPRPPDRGAGDADAIDRHDDAGLSPFWP